jgi:hypothetical protein
MFLAVGLTVASLGWLLTARAEHAEIRPLGIHDGGFDALKGRMPDGFPSEIFTWGGDPSEIVSVGGHPTALRFLEAAGEPNIPNSPPPAVAGGAGSCSLSPPGTGGLPISSRASRISVAT